MSSQNLVLVERPRDAVACLTLNRPAKKNALSIALRDEVTAMLERLAADEAVRVVVLTGAGGAFSAGFDLGPDHAWRQRSGDLCTARVRAGEEDAVHRLRDQRRTGRSSSDDDLEDALRHAGLAHQLADRESGQRRVLGGLVEHRVAREQRRHEHVRALADAY